LAQAKMLNVECPTYHEDVNSELCQPWLANEKKARGSRKALALRNLRYTNERENVVHQNYIFPSDGPLRISPGRTASVAGPAWTEANEKQRKNERK
jgi:hypothetical protein